MAWLSLDTWLVSLLSIGYLGILFLVAHWGQKYWQGKWLRRTWVYSLALGISCTTWAFYGVVGRAADTGEWLAPIYIGTIACVILGWPLLLRILRIVKQQNLTSITDFIACRYDKSPLLAGLLALVSLFALIPYISLQLKAISTSFDLLTGTYQSGMGTTFGVTLVLIIFSILFGARHLTVSAQNPGLLISVAFGSIVKLLAMTSVGIFATLTLLDSPGSFELGVSLLEQQSQPGSALLLVSQIVLGTVSILVLPQEFHMMMIENKGENELRAARWQFPLYLIAINLFVLPIAVAGLISFPGGSIDADTFVLTLPLYFQHGWLGLVVYIGGLAAAISMVVVSSIVLSTLLSNEVITPLRLNTRQLKPSHGGVLLLQRRVLIGCILVAAFVFERLLEQQKLADIGLLSFVLLAQFAPAMIGAMYWKRATTQGALAGLMAGTFIWLLMLLLPTALPDSRLVTQGILGIDWLSIQYWIAQFGVESIVSGLAVSILANTALFVLFSLRRSPSVGELLQAKVFLEQSSSVERHPLELKDLSRLLEKFIGPEAKQELLDYASLHTEVDKLTEFARLKLVGVLGSASTRMILNAAVAKQQTNFSEVIDIVEEATQLFEFNRELLQAGVENIDQGISVIDSDMRLVAWNQRYIALMDYPDDLVKPGMPVRDLLEFNLRRGVIPATDTELQITRRLAHMQAGSKHTSRRTMPTGQILEVKGRPMPGGGFVSTYTDITRQILAEEQLKQNNAELEARVTQRTEALAQAKAEAEAANRSKTRFLAAASHDLMQPFNALTLFSSMLSHKVQGDKSLAELATNIEHSLGAVETLLSDLVEISRLDNNLSKADIQDVPLSSLLFPLATEFELDASAREIEFRYRPTSVQVKTDLRLLRRIVQNLLSNAVRYSPPGRKVLLGVRRRHKTVSVQVWDQGPGIPVEKQQTIFEEFERLESNAGAQGLGLGLAICERIAKLLNTSITLSSTPGKGSCFTIDVPVGNTRLKIQDQAEPAEGDISLNVLVIDNDALMLKALSGQLQDWGVTVFEAENEAQAGRLAQTENIDLVLADYHLDQDCNGADLYLALKAQGAIAQDTPGIICSADPSETVRSHTNQVGCGFIRKPVKPLALRRQLKRIAKMAATNS